MQTGREVRGDGVEGSRGQAFRAEKQGRSMLARSGSHWPATSDQVEEATQPHRPLLPDSRAARPLPSVQVGSQTKENQFAL